MKVLSYGGGQDSTTILDRDLETNLIGFDAVVFSDTGNEHPHTYATVELLQRRCEAAGVEFAWLTPDLGYHGETWQSLTGQWERNGSITSRAFGKVCTDKLKITPIYKWLNARCARILGEQIQDHGKKNILSYVEQFGKIEMFIGIATGEEKRVGKEDGAPKWMRESIERKYPLIDWGWDRQACQDYLEAASERVGKVWPSNCLFCHYQSPQELLWLSRRYPERYAEWVGHEQRKIEKYAGREKNYGVYGAKLLPVKLIEAEEQHGHMSDAELDTYKFSHGHCVRNAY